MDEREAIACARRRDLAGLEGLVALHQQAAMRLAVLITRDRAVAQDVVSESFLTAFERIGQFDETRPFRPWFYRIVINRALKWTARNRRLVSLDQHGDDDLAGALERLASLAPDPAEMAAEAEARAAVRAALGALSPRQRAVLYLRYFEGYSEAETAAALGVPRGTVKSRLAAGTQRLRGLLAGLRSR